MSLFQAREFWSAATGTDEEFGGGCLAVANLDNDPNGLLKLATGSFGGVLRLYLPREREFKLEDLMLEQSLDRPILQLLAGRFTSDSERVALAVLHPRALTVYLVAASATDGGKKQAAGAMPSYFTLSKMYEHPLERPMSGWTTPPYHTCNTAPRAHLLPRMAQAALPSPERSLSSVEACHGLSMSPQGAQKLKHPNGARAGLRATWSPVPSAVFTGANTCACNRWTAS